MVEPTITLPDILLQARRAYEDKPQDTASLITSGFFGRTLHFIEGITLAELLDRSRPQNILIVGPSMDSTTMGSQCYDIIEVLAYMYSNGIEAGQVDALDLNPNAYKVWRTNCVAACYWDHATFNGTFKESWARFLEYVKDETRMTPEKWERFFWGKEYFYAGIPPDLSRMLEKVSLNLGSIVTVHLPLNGVKYDLVFCRNVLYQLGEHGQKLALYNMSQSMKEGALLLVGAGFGLNAEIRQPDIHPKLTSEWQATLGLNYLEGYGDMVLQRLKTNN